MKQKVSDNQQRISIALGFGLEVYRALMAAFLIAFVPQSCGSGDTADGSAGSGDTSCGVTDNLFTGSDGGYLAASSLNVITFAVFMYLYYVEISRENKMISYLEMNRELPKDNESVGEALVAIGADKVAELHLLDAKYRHAGYGAMAFFGVNTVVSAIPILGNALDAKTYTVLITNVLFIVSKLMEVREIVNTPENVFYSAYLTERQQFNDADPDAMGSDRVEELPATDTGGDGLVPAIEAPPSEEEECLVPVLEAPPSEEADGLVPGVEAPPTSDEEERLAESVKSVKSEDAALTAAENAV